MIVPRHWQYANEAGCDWIIQCVVHDGVCVLIAIKHLNERETLKFGISKENITTKDTQLVILIFFGNRGHIREINHRVYGKREQQKI